VSHDHVTTRCCRRSNMSTRSSGLLSSTPNHTEDRSRAGSLRHHDLRATTTNHSHMSSRSPPASFAYRARFPRSPIRRYVWRCSVGAAQWVWKPPLEETSDFHAVTIEDEWVWSIRSEVLVVSFVVANVARHTTPHHEKSKYDRRVRSYEFFRL
jgi:hypothetical protein